MFTTHPVQIYTVQVSHTLYERRNRNGVGSLRASPLQQKLQNMVPPETLHPDVYTDTFIFFLRSLCEIIWMNVYYFPNAPRIYRFPV